MNTNYDNTQVPVEKKNTAIKSLAIVGVIAILCLIVWALVQAVRVGPSAFVSLANIADGLYSSEVPLSAGTSKSVVNTGEPFYVTWSDVNRPGTYYFSYICVEGVSAEARDARGDIVAVTCETPFLLVGETGELELILEGEKRRFTDVGYTVSFVREDEENPAYKEEHLVTIVNASITQSSIHEEDAITEDDAGEEAVAGASDSTTDTAENTGSTGGNTGATGGTIRTEPVTTTYFPTSNPNGNVDLQVTYLGIGSLDSDNDFTYRLTLDNDRRGALRFEVRNVGSKTSDDWEFEATLPTGSKYESPEQDGLRPNERAVITLGFDNVGDPRKAEVEVEISGGDDENNSNNSFKKDVEIVN